MLEALKDSLNAETLITFGIILLMLAIVFLAGRYGAEFIIGG